MKDAIGSRKKKPNSDITDIEEEKDGEDESDENNEYYEA